MRNKKSLLIASLSAADPGASAGLAFMRAAAVAMPKTLGDRERIAAMTSAMLLAVKNRFAFDKGDVKELQRLGIETCVGVFRPMDFYIQACLAGGTYPRMWEAHNGIKPWVAARAIVSSWDSDHLRQEVLDNNRVAPGMAVILPESGADGEHGSVGVELSHWNGEPVWWVTSMKNDTINLSRYHARGPGDTTWGRNGRPVRVWAVSRDEWLGKVQKPTAVTAA